VTIRAVVFDLFDTLVDLHYEDLPRLEHEGRALPATVGALHAAVAERAEVGFPAFLEALAAVDRELREARYAEGLEVPTEERFVRLLEELGVDDGELPAALTAVHMGMLRSTVAVPGHHAGVLAQLGRRMGLGLCSNFSHAETALAILEEAGIHALLDVVAISETVGYRKPRPEIFQAVLEAFDLAPDPTSRSATWRRSPRSWADRLCPLVRPGAHAQTSFCVFVIFPARPEGRARRPFRGPSLPSRASQGTGIKMT
jgi:FMN phosphatase YigB (HAD superfamily)